MTLAVLLVGLTALAGQTSFEVDRGARSWGFDVRWTDDAGEERRARFSLPADAIEADLARPFRYDNRAASEAAAAAVNGASFGDATVRASASGPSVRIHASGPDRYTVRAALREAGRVRDEAWDQAVLDAGYVRLEDGSISPDYAAHAVAYAPAVSPIVAALGGPGASPRAFADVALPFVQSIPFEETARRRDRYRRPLSLVGRNRGDCDSKVVLFLAMMRSAWPQTDAAVVLIPGHALVALDLEDPGVDTIRVAGEDWVAAEAVGPALTRVGEIDRRTRRAIARRGTIWRLRAPVSDVLSSTGSPVDRRQDG